jgi:hypothetical protein
MTWAGDIYPRVTRGIRFPSMGKHQIATRRWITLAAYAASAIAFWTLFASALRSQVSALEQTHGLAIGWGFIVVCASLWACLLPKRTPGSRPASLLEFANWQVFPPAWLASAFSCAVYLALICYETYSLVSLVNVVAFIVILAATWWIVNKVIRRAADKDTPVLTIHLNRNGLPRGLASSVDHSLQTFDQLVEWSKTDDPITSVDKDRFDVGRIAERIATRLMQNPPPSMQVVGDLGSGKSSLGHLTKEALHLQQASAKHKTKFEWLQVSAWQYQTPEALAQGLLNELLHALSPHVSTRHLRGLPSQYIEAVASSGTHLSVLAPLLRSGESPDAVVSQIADLCAAIDLRIVLWVEDLERFATNTSNSASDNAGGSADAKLGSIRALLYLINSKSPSLTVIVASTSLSTRFDEEKIARYIEQVPKLDAAKVWRAISLVRSRCRSDFPSAYLHATPRQQNMQMEDEYDSSTLANTFREHSDSPLGVASAASEIITTPRELKHVIRIILDAWNHLYGEIDFDSLMAISIIRVCEPRVFAFISERVEFYKRVDTESDHWKARNASVQEAYRNIVSDYSARRQNAIVLLMSFTFPHYAYNDSPQGFKASLHRNVWRQYISLARSYPRTSDQAVLSAISDWRLNGSIQTLAPFFTQPLEEFIASPLEVLWGDSNQTEVHRLIEQVLRYALDNYTSRRGDSERAVKRLQSFLNNRRIGTDIEHYFTLDSERTIIETFAREATETNLAFLHILFVTFVHRPSMGSYPAFFSSSESQAFATTINAHIFATYNSPLRAQPLLNALRSSDSHALHNILLRVHDYSLDGLMNIHERSDAALETFFSTLLDAADIDPVVVVPQYVELFVETNHEASANGVQSRYVVRTLIAETLFNATRLKDQLRSVDLGSMPTDVREKLGAAVRWATQDPITPS